MNDHERYGRMSSAVLSIGGHVSSSQYYDSGYMTVEGMLDDGRKIHFWVESKENQDEHRSES